MVDKLDEFEYNNFFYKNPLKEPIIKTHYKNPL